MFTECYTFQMLSFSLKILNSFEIIDIQGVGKDATNLPQGFFTTYVLGCFSEFKLPFGLFLIALWRLCTPTKLKNLPWQHFFR